SIVITWTAGQPPCPTVADATASWGAGNFHIIDTTHADANGHFATSGNDNLFGFSDDMHNYIVDLVGSNTIHAGPKGDIICTGGGNDRIFGGSGADAIFAGDGNDNASGGGGVDFIFGGGGNDFLTAGGDGTTLIGGAGSDYCNKGSFTVTVL